MDLTLSIPESLSEVTLNQYQQWLKVAEGKDMNNFLQQKMVEIFCDVSLKQVLQMKVKDVDEITKDINKMFTDKNKLIKTFTLDNQEYGFIPKLDDMAFGEYIDLDTYLSDWQNMHKAMNVLFRPVTYKPKKKWYNFFTWWSIDESKYLIEDYKGSGRYNLKEMPLDIVFGSLVFFWNLKNELQKHILNYLAMQTEVPISHDLRDSLKSGAGINQFTTWQQGTLQNLMT